MATSGEFSYINQYWAPGFSYKCLLREDLNASSKSAILVAPTMGSKPGYSLNGNPDLGIFGRPGGAECFLDHVMQWLGNYDPHYTVIPTVRKVILAGHSGGGSPIHIQMESLKAKICEIWCFDVVYFTVNDWIQFGVNNPTKQVYFYYAEQSLDALKELKKLKDDTEKSMKRPLGNVQFIDAGNHHYPALTNNFGKRIKESNCLSAR